jgi:hypothetical protein
MQNRSEPKKNKIPQESEFQSIFSFPYFSEPEVFKKITLLFHFNVMHSYVFLKEMWIFQALKCNKQR